MGRWDEHSHALPLSGKDGGAPCGDREYKKVH